MIWTNIVTQGLLLGEVRAGVGEQDLGGEIFLAQAFQHVRARSGDSDSAYGTEAETEGLPPELTEAARALDRGLLRLIAPLIRLAARLRARLDKEAADLDSDMRVRIDFAGFLRETKKFANPAELVKQLERDRESSLRLLSDSFGVESPD